MAWTFPNYKSAYYDNASFLNDLSEFSFSMRLKLNNLRAGAGQNAFGHYASPDRIEFWKSTAATPRMKWSVTAGGVYVACQDSSWTVATGEVHTWGGTWLKNNANGMDIYRDGSAITTVSTTTQTSNYTPGTTVDFYIGASKSATNYLEGTMEDVQVWTTRLTSTQMAQIHKGYFWYQIPGCPRPKFWWRLFPASVSGCPDWSGSGAPIDAAHVDSGVTSEAWIGRTLGIRRRYAGQHHRASAAGPPAPNPWTLDQETPAGVTAALVSGLVNGTAYQFKVTAVDESGNESSDSNIIEKTPSAPPPVATTYPTPWLSLNRRSKYRASQQ